MSRLYVGVDTSNYTTSLALLDEELRVIANLKRPLPVGEGERGLRQSDAVFAHTKHLPELWEELSPYLRDGEIAAVGVSTRPRNVDGSYMPCFLAGVSSAVSAASALGVPLYRFSHQCGHLMAALLSSERLELADAPFAAYHVSGGTTELLLVSPKGAGFSCEIVGGTRDISAGQLVDRVGVALGLPFPAGAELERLALTFRGKVPHRRPRVIDCRVNLSGSENLALKLYSETNDPAAVAAFVLGHIADALTGMTDECFAVYGKRPLVCAGGVMSAKSLRSLMESRYGAATASPALSADNAVGIAALAARADRGSRDV